MKTGVLRVHSVAVFLMKVESIMAKKPFLGPMMGFGTLLVIGAGGTRESVSNIDGGPNISGRRSRTRVKQTAPARFVSATLCAAQTIGPGSAYSRECPDYRRPAAIVSLAQGLLAC